MKLEELLHQIRGIKIAEEKEAAIEIHHLEMDSREVRAGTLFFCINGYTVDGHDFAKSAYDNGAVAIIAEKELDLPIPVFVVRDTKRVMAQLANRFYDNPTKKLQLIGVTGTNGKTSVTHILDQLFKQEQRTTGLIGTMYTKVGDEVIETKNTTPESLVLQQRFQTMVDQNVDTAFMEVSSHALHLGRVRGCDFDIAIFTNLSPDHIDYHQTMDHYMYAKSLLFSQLGNTYDGKTAIFNSDDQVADQLIQMTTADIITYGIKKPADIMASDVRIESNGTTFTLTVFGESVEIKMSLIGLFNVYNVLAAVSAAYVSGFSLPSIQKGLAHISGIAGRFEPIDSGQDFAVIVDYAHTPDSLENVLKTVQDFASNKVRVVVGCGGDRDKSKRPVMGEIAVRYADETIFTSDNPRTENPSMILQDMTAGLDRDQYRLIEDRTEAIHYAMNQAEKNDIIVIAGKGHETYQEIGRTRTYFDDREVARTALKERVK